MQPAWERLDAINGRSVLRRAVEADMGNEGARRSGFLCVDLSLLGPEAEDRRVGREAFVELLRCEGQVETGRHREELYDELVLAEEGTVGDPSEWQIFEAKVKMRAKEEVVGVQRDVNVLRSAARRRKAHLFLPRCPARRPRAQLPPDLQAQLVGDHLLTTGVGDARTTVAIADRQRINVAGIDG